MVDAGTCWPPIFLAWVRTDLGLPEIVTSPAGGSLWRSWTTPPAG